ncbi:MAG: GAF domain-containing protein [Anaerolineae bacterium]|nr:GAF domain-containing protein [Anaerolineae bacterium]
MIFIYFVYGLSFFSMGLAVWLESRHASDLPLGHHLRWLGAFGLLHGCAEWLGMLRLLYPHGLLVDTLQALETLLLPIAAILLIRFGIGLVEEAGPIPAWLEMVPVILLVPAMLAVSYGLVVALTFTHVDSAAEVWSRYLLYLPGNVLAAAGFWWQLRCLKCAGSSRARYMLLGACLAFLGNALTAGLIVPEAPYGLAPWLNYNTVLSLTNLPIQVVRTLSALGVMYFVIRALRVFETERQEHIAQLEREREQARQNAYQVQVEARQGAEQWLAGLVNVSRSIANAQDMDEVLKGIVILSRDLLKSGSAALALMNRTCTELDLKCYATDSGATIVAPRPVQSPIIRRAAQLGAPIRYPEDVALSERHWVCPILGREFSAVAIVPLRLDGHVLGALWVARYEDQPFTPTDLSGLERLADQAVIALEHASMTARIQSLAVTEERARIAREMHDSLAQVLGYLSLQTQTLEALVKQGDQAALLSELRQARDTIGAAQADVRESILSLRTTLAGDIGLIAALEKYVDEFSVQTGIDVKLINGLHEQPALSPVAETQMVRIVQEALTNIRKHAHAHSAEVRLYIEDDELHVRIDDDGIGIQQPAIKRNHFGLQTMRERAESVGGDLAVTSIPNEGTQVELYLPLIA